MDAPAARGFPRGGRNFRMTGVRRSHPDRADGPTRLDRDSVIARMVRLYKIAHKQKNEAAHPARVRIGVSCAVECPRAAEQ
jgi:hypothetical protein